MILKMIRMKKEDGDVFKKSVEKAAQVLMDMGVPSSEAKTSETGGTWMDRARKMGKK